MFNITITLTTKLHYIPNYLRNIIYITPINPLYFSTFFKTRSHFTKPLDTFMKNFIKQVLLGLFQIVWTGVWEKIVDRWSLEQPQRPKRHGSLCSPLCRLSKRRFSEVTQYRRNMKSGCPMTKIICKSHSLKFSFQTVLPDDFQAGFEWLRPGARISHLETSF
jgi:hypothetical protein